MGVNGLWQILSSAGQLCSLEELKGKRLAVDLSCWICESCQTKGLAEAVRKPHLRNLFFRLLNLYVEVGAELVFVIDGYATSMKWDTMDQRMSSVPYGSGGARKTGIRHQLNQKLKECCELLEAAGLPYIKSRGEAESLCALINKEGYVDGVITDDSDALLYGATVVYRQLSIKKNVQFEKYTINNISSILGFSRDDLVKMSVFLGCDYLPCGVPGFGKENTLKIIKENERLLEIILKGEHVELTELEKDMKLTRKFIDKAMEIPHFFDNAAAVINEYLHPNETLPHDPTYLFQWRMPNITFLQDIFCKELSWDFHYALDKIAKLLTYWVLCERRQRKDVSGIKPQKILARRVRNFIPHYEVEWCATLPSQCDKESPWIFKSLEKADLFKTCYPDLCSEFEDQKAIEKTRKKKEKKIPKKSEDVSRSGTIECSSHMLSLVLDDTRITAKSHQLYTKLDKLSTDSLSSSLHTTPLSLISPVSTSPSPLSSVHTTPEKDASSSPLKKRPSPSKTLLATPEKRIECQLSSDEEEVLPLMERLKMSSPLKPHMKESNAKCKRRIWDSEECPIEISD